MISLTEVSSNTNLKYPMIAAVINSFGVVWTEPKSLSFQEAARALGMRLGNSSFQQYSEIFVLLFLRVITVFIQAG